MAIFSLIIFWKFALLSCQHVQLVYKPNPLFLNVKMLTKLIHFHSRNFAISLTGIFQGFVLFFVSLLLNDRYPHDFMNVKTQEKNIGIPCEQLLLTKPSAFHLSAMVHHKFNFLQGLPFINFKAWRIYLPKNALLWAS